MNIYGNNFTYDNIPASRFNVMLCSFEPPPETRETAIARTILRGETGPYRDVPNFYAAKYTDVLKFDAALIKCDGSPLTSSERREIVAWLTGPATPAWLTIDDEDHKGIEYRALCLGYSEYRPDSQLRGLLFNFECDAPYGYSPEEMIEFQATPDAPATFTIQNTSDERRADYYPILEIKAGATGTVTIKNSVYPEDILELSLINGQQLTIDNRQGLIEDPMGMFDYGNDTNLQWLRLAYGANTLTVTGSASGCVRCRYIRKVGI